MKRVLSVSCLLLILLSASCGSSRHTPEGTQEQFGVRMAKMNLWREALFRFKRAVDLSPGDAQAHNNLAVAYEANGDFEAAAKEYREAMRLDKSNQYIQKNYSRLVEFMSRNKKRQRTQTAATKPATTEAAATPPPATPSASPELPKPEAPATGEPGSGSGAPPATTPAAIPPTAAPPATTPAAVPPAAAPPATTTAPPAPQPPAKSGGQS